MDFTDNDAPFDDFSVDNSELNFNAPDEPEDFLLNATDNLGHAQILFQSNAPNMDQQLAGTQLLIMSQPQVVSNLSAVATSAPIIVQPSAVSGGEIQAKVRKTRSPKKKKDPNAPAGACSAYTLFFRDTQATIKSKNPGAKFGDISKIVASMWEALGENEKAVYKRRNEEDKARFQREMEAYKAGSFQQPEKMEEDYADESTKEVFTSTLTTTNISSIVSKMAEPEERTENPCIRQGCGKAAIKSSEWDDEYCSNECAVVHCKNVFAAWVSEQRA